MVTYWENGCPFGLQYVFLVYVPDCKFNFFWSGNFCAIVAYFYFYFHCQEGGKYIACFPNDPSCVSMRFFLLIA